MNTHKFWLRSKTVLFNLMLALAGSWTLIEASLGNLKASVSPATYGTLMAAVGVLGIILRFATTKAVTATPAPPK